MKRHPFNLIELMLALGVIVIGLVSVMALFPIGASANRDAMAENYSSQAAEQLLNTLAFHMRLSNGNWTSATASIPLEPSTAANKKTMLSTQADYFPDNNVCAFLASGTDNIHWETAGDYSSGFRIQSGGTTTQAMVDFEAMVALWHEPIQLGGGPKSTISTTLHIEVSWPAQLPYERRRKARYSLQVFNPNL